MKVGVIDYGVGNLGSVARALEELSATPLLIDKAIDIHFADSLILPGVGNFTDCKQLLDAGGWTTALREEVLGNNRPLLGVCLGMQLLADASAEGSSENNPTEGLGLVPGIVKHLSAFGAAVRVPHVGWNSINLTQQSDLLLAGIPDGTDFYFVHSYAFVPESRADILAETEYGKSITAVVRRGNVWGTQFHPEKSSKAGFRVLRNFIEGSLAC